jgi:Zn-dependent protease
MFDFSPERLQFVLLAVVTMILSSAVHEWAHAFTAVKLGDDTPARQGRLTLNPIVHIDVIGTILMPAIGAMVGFLFGYAKPVQFLPHRLTRKVSMRVGTALIALAGPVSNLILAFLCAGILKVIVTVAGPGVFAESDVANMAGALLFTAVWLNIVLFVFNFLPVYPLDGEKILAGVLPRRFDPVLETLRQHSMLVMLFIFFIGVRFLAGPIIALVRLVLRIFQLGAELAPVIYF